MGDIDRRTFLKTTAAAVLVPGTCQARARHETINQSRTVAEVDAAIVRRFVNRLDGRALLPDSPGYAEAAQDWAGQMPVRPGLVVRCRDTQDVVAAVGFAREHGLPLAVRSGGHAFRSTAGGVLVNLTGLRRIEMDARGRTARADAGLTLGDFDRATAPASLAAVLGECPSVGMAGYTLGGGLGRLMGQFGSASDNLIAAEVVTADARVVRAGADENPDLFWAIRGGGGNFGIVTSFAHRLHPVGPVLAGTLRFPLAQARRALRVFREVLADAPDHLDALLEIGAGILQYGPGIDEPSVLINVCCGDNLDAAEKTLKPLRTFERPLADDIRRMTYAEAQTMGANLAGMQRRLNPAHSRYVRHAFVTTVADDVIDAIVAQASSPPSPWWSISLDHYLHGAICRPREDDSAFALRQTGYSIRVFAFQEGPPPAERSISWVRSLHQTLDRFSSGRMYVNYLTDQGAPGVRASFGSNYARLAALKSKYDPTNLFRLNPNIEPV